MKLYGRKFATRKMQKETEFKTETRDAVLWQIDWANRICKVKIQGSNEQIAAHFPQNIAAYPKFMKTGNAVRIAHRGGKRGYFEVIGHGMAIPTPVTGAAHPDTSGLADVVLTGCYVNAAGGFDVDISDGTYRINGTTYSISGGAFGTFMNDSDPMLMKSPYAPAVMGQTGVYFPMTDPTEYIMNNLAPPIQMGEVITTITLDPPPSGNKFRYDCFYVDVNGFINYLKGTEASSNPTKPTIPADTVLLGGYILLWTGLTEITNEQIGLDWTTPIPTQLELTYDDTFEWDFGNNQPETNIQVDIQDQYGFPISDVYTIVLTMLIGTGWIWSSYSGYSETTVQQQISGYSYTFKYRRSQPPDSSGVDSGGAVAEQHPYIMVTVNDTDLTQFVQITLFDEFGEGV